jgi:GH18 family chitinase
MRCALLTLAFLRTHAWTSPAVFSYLPEWRYAGANYETIASQSTHLALFSAEPAADGALTGLDRLPAGADLAEARAAAARHGCALVVCFGGNGRSAHFSAVVRSKEKRARFAAAAAALVADLGLDGIDLNWEYPGFAFGSGYASDAEARADYRGLRMLVTALRRALGPKAALTLAYYPDTKQEAALAAGNFARDVDLMHAMSYDAPGAQHAPRTLADSVITNARAAGLPLHKVTVGLPCYGRAAKTGEWTTYEDLVQRHAPLARGVDAVPAPGGGGDTIGFNGLDTLVAKTRAALAAGAGGVMIWEAGQDCRTVAVTRGGATHGVTCPGGRADSLLAAVWDAVVAANATAARAAAGGEL